MRVLVTGASGFIGGALVHALLREGHEVICASRRPAHHADTSPACRGLAVDFEQAPQVEWWLPRLERVDAVINAVGILREQRGQSFDALHHRAPAELFKACVQARVANVVQVSALGADAGARSRYHLSKKAADDVLRGLPLRSVIVQPSLVYGPGGTSAAMFNGMAALPILALPGGGTMQVQPVHIDDLVAGILALLAKPPARQSTIAFVGLRALTLREFLGKLRAGMGLEAPLRVVPVPQTLFRAAAAVAGLLPGSFLDSETADMLLRGNVAPADAFAALLGRSPRLVSSFIDPARRAAILQQAMLGNWVPVLRGSIAFLWLWTGIVSLGLYPVADSLELLSRVGLQGLPAHVALYGAAGLDLLLGAATLMVPRGRRGLVWAAQLLLIAGYTVLITLFLPEYWLHPYGPITKNLPVMAAIALLWSLEAGTQKDTR